MWWPAREETKRKFYTNIIILPQLYQREVLFRSDGNQGIDNVQQRILHRYDWPGMRERIKDRRDLEEDSYEIMGQFYNERKGLLYHTADDVVACKRRDEEKIFPKHNHTTAAISNGVAAQIARSDGTSRNRQGATKNTAPI